MPAGSRNPRCSIPHVSLRSSEHERPAYMPLGLWPHVCLGKALSTIILTTMLACILANFASVCRRISPMWNLS